MSTIIRITSFVLLLAIPSCTSSTPADSSASSAPGHIVHEPLTDHGRSEERSLQHEAKWDAFYATPHDNGDTLVVGIFDDVDSLNDLTASSWNASILADLLFLGLTRTNADHSHAPSLAESWKFSEDHLELTFHLRDDVYWHDGVKTTAHDVKFTFEKHTSPDIGWPTAKWKQYIKECVVLDDRTVTFVFERVYPYQLRDAAEGVILPKHILEKVPEEEMVSAQFNRNPVGNRPFRFKEWQAQQYVEVAANENYFAGRPPLDRIIFKVVPDLENLVIQMKSGEIDFLERVSPRFFEELSREEDLEAHILPGHSYTYIAWNPREPIFDSKKVRQALTLAISRQDIVDSILLGFGDVVNGPILPIIWTHNPNLLNSPHDPEKAKQYLAEEGWKDTDGDGWLDRDGQRFSFTLKTNKGNQLRTDAVVLLQDMLKGIGVEVKPNILEWTILIDDSTKKNFEAMMMGWTSGTKMDMTTIWHSESINDKYNFVSYANPEFDRLNDAAMFEMDEKKAMEMWWRAQEVIAEDQPYTFLFSRQQLNIVHSRFQNVQMETVAWFYNLEQWWVPQDQQKY